MRVGYLSLAAAVAVALERQKEIRADIPRCRRCNSDQVQLVDSDRPAHWKCRICKRRFVYEPVKD